jgi:outer membrane protein assembly factor BamB
MATIGLNRASDVRASPTVYNDKVYVGTLDGNLYCLDMKTGAVSWKYQTGGPILAAVTIADNAIYVPSSTDSPNGTFYKLDLSGNLIWKKSIPYVLDLTPGAGYWLFTTPTYADGVVFLRNAFRLNYAINATTGDTIWTYDGQYNPGTPSQLGGVMQINAMVYSYGKLYFNDFYGITCLDAKNGSVIWTTWLSRENLAQGLAYSYGRIYTVSELGALYVLDALTGDKISVSTDFGFSQIRSAPSLYNGNLYVGANDWNLRCFGEARTMVTNDAPTPSVVTTQVSVSDATQSPIFSGSAKSDVSQVLTPVVSPLPTVTESETPALSYAVIATAVIIVVVALAGLLLRKRKQ